MNDEKNMDKAFRDKLDGFNADPPAHLWDGIQGKLAAQSRNRRMAYYSWASAAALIVLAFLAGWYFSSDTAIQSASEMAQSENAPINKIAPENQEAPIREQIENIEISNNESDNQIANAAKPVNQKSREVSVIKTTATDFADVSKKEIAENSDVDIKLLKSIDANFLKNSEINPLKQTRKIESNYRFTDEERKIIADNASNNRENKVQNRGWKMGLNVSPGYSSYSSNHSESYAQDMAYSASEGSGNMGAGFSLQYKTGKKWSIESGVYYAKSGQKSQTSFELFARNNNALYGDDLTNSYAPPKALTAGQMAMNSTAGVIALDKLPAGTEIAASPESEINFSNTLLTRGEFSQVFDFIEIPMYLRYNIIDSKVDIDLMGGVNAGLVVGNNAYLDNAYGVQNIGKTEDVSALNMSGTVGVGVNYELGRHLSLAVEPRFSYYLNSINRNPAVDFRPYRIGVYTGLYYDF